MTLSIESGFDSGSHYYPDDFDEFWRAHANLPPAVGYVALEDMRSSAPSVAVPEAEMDTSDHEGRHGILHF